MALTPEALAARKHVIGSSDAPVVLGADPHRSRLALYLEKVHEIETEQEVTEPMRLGNRFEGAILEEAAEKLGVRIQRDVTVQGPEPYLAANLDAVVLRDSTPAFLALAALEAKFTGLGHLFGEPGLDSLPDKVLIQTAHQMGCLLSLELVHVPVLLARYGRPRVELYVAPRVPNLVEVVMEECRRFWLEHVLPRIPPDPTPGLEGSALGVLKRIRRQPATTARVDPALALAYQEASRQAKEAEGAKEAAQAALLAAGGEVEALDFGDAKKLFTYLSYPRAGFDHKQLLRDMPHLAEKYSTLSHYRALKLVNK